MKLKNKTKYKFKYVDKLSLILIIIFILSYIFLNIFNNKALPILTTYAEEETTKLSTLIINKAVLNLVEANQSIDSLIITTKNKEQEIISVDFDTIKVNQALNNITNTIEANLKLLEEGNLELLDLPVDNIYETEKVSRGLIYYIPFGSITNIPILTGIGPKVPIKTNLIGSVTSNVRTEITNYGINNALLKIYIEVNVNEQVILPFISKKITTSSEIPVLVKLIQGKVPEVYGGMYKKASPYVYSNSLSK